MEIKRAGSRPSAKGPSDWFTGTVRVDPLFEAPGPARASGASVTFEPGARTAWHTHPLGQTLIVTSGAGRVQKWGGPVEEIRPGDVVWFEPEEKHWHGASPTVAMTHIAIQEAVNGKVVDWMEKVSEEQYDAKGQLTGEPLAESRYQAYESGWAVGWADSPGQYPGDREHEFGRTLQPCGTRPHS